MATQVAAREVIRQKRERGQEVLVWPDLVFIEFIAAVLFTLGFIVLSIFVDAPLLNRANANVTPNPSKAPWYFMNLQELLLHMHPALAGVIVPTIALVGLAVMPYIDRSNEGQGQYFATRNSARITLFSSAFAAVGTVLLIVYDQSRHVRFVEWLVRHWDENWSWPTWAAPFRDVRSIQTGWTWKIKVPFQPGSGPHDGYLNWPVDFTHIPMPFNGTWLVHWGRPTWAPGWLQALYWYDLNLNFPAFLVEILIPVALMVGLPVVLILILRRLGWVQTTHDVMIVLFSGFVTVYWVMTIVGAAFRGAGQDLVLPWDVPRPEG